MTSSQVAGKVSYDSRIGGHQSYYQAARASQRLITFHDSRLQPAYSATEESG